METEKKKWPVDLGTDGGQRRVTSKKKYYLLKGRGGGRREATETFLAMNNMENGEINKNAERAV